MCLMTVCKCTANKLAMHEEPQNFNIHYKTDATNKNLKVSTAAK